MCVCVCVLVCARVGVCNDITINSLCSIAKDLEVFFALNAFQGHPGTTEFIRSNYI